MSTAPLTAPAPISRQAMLVVIACTAWFVAALAAGALGVFRAAPGTPPLAVGLAATVPPLAALALALASPRFRAWAASLDLRFLTMVQTWRTVGLAFLALASVGALPEGFALPAGYGDVAVGMTAPLVAWFIVGRSDRLYLAWSVFGIADLIAALTLGVLLVDVDLMGDLPMSLIPTFGVPLTLVVHILALTNLATRTFRPQFTPAGVAAQEVSERLDVRDPAVDGMCRHRLGIKEGVDVGHRGRDGRLQPVESAYFGSRTGLQRRASGAV